jgi:sulfite exporter TauE/SafE
MNWRYWLVRLWLSFLIIGFVVFWTGYKALQAATDQPIKSYCEIGGGILLIALGLAAVRERHRPPE